MNCDKCKNHQKKYLKNIWKYVTNAQIENSLQKVSTCTLIGSTAGTIVPMIMNIG